MNACRVQELHRQRQDPILQKPRQPSFPPSIGQSRPQKRPGPTFPMHNAGVGLAICVPVAGRDLTGWGLGAIAGTVNGVDRERSPWE